MADLTDMQEHVLPYLQSFCSLEEKTLEKSRRSSKSICNWRRSHLKELQTDKEP